MKTITLTKKQFEKCSPYIIDKDIVNSEAEFYIINKGKYKGKYLMKKLFINEGKIFANKLLTISLLNDMEHELGIEELCIPKHLISVDDEVIGFSIPKINNPRNLGLVLNNPKVDSLDKLRYLEEVGNILRKIQKQNVLDLSIGDLQPYNILIDKNNKLHIIDLDSAYINTNYPIPSFYISNKNTFVNLTDFGTKYNLVNFVEEEEKEGDKTSVVKIPTRLVRPDTNSDLLCYNFMIINTLANYKINNLDVSTYHDYITYLETLGYGEDIINSFRNIYSNADNVNPVDFFSDIPLDKVGLARYKVYKKNMKNN